MEKSYPKVRFIIDPSAGAKDLTREITAAVKRVFGSANGFYEIRVIRPNDDASTLAKEARYKDYSGVVVCGGDSVVREASLSIVQSDTALGIVPIGERNTISDSFGISRDIEKALGNIRASNLSSIDVGRIADRYFFVNAGLGFDVALSGYVGASRTEGSGNGVVRYLSSLLIDFRKFNPIPLVIKVNEKTLISAPLLARFALKDLTAPGASRKAGISLNIVPQIKFSQAARKMKKLLYGAFESIDGFKDIAASGTLEVERTNSGPLHADGESFLAGTKFEVTLINNALKVWQGSAV
jgi:diacylglycerol kinase (ATP)